MKPLRHYAPGLFILLLLAVAGWMIYLKLHPKVLPDNLVMGVGRMDGDLVRLNAKYPYPLLKLGLPATGVISLDELPPL
ncbi:hypothetical protein [Nitratifractor sp.]